MNFKKVEKAAKKINQLLDNMKDEEEVSKIEKDLLLSYIRSLYEKVIDSEESSKRIISEAPTQRKVVKDIITGPKVEGVGPTPPPAIEIADVVRQEIKETAYQADPISVQQPIESPIYVHNNMDYKTAATTLKDEPEPTKNKAPQELLDLFAAESVNELSDKLSRSPVLDLTKCMGINERIFTVNELFGGDSGLFKTTMQELDKLNSIEQARDFLVNSVAIDQNWISESKMKKATNFVKLISRRY